MKNQEEKGQIILLLIVVMTLALAIGLSIFQKSLVDVTNSTKVEESSRAFSAAEAGIEQILGGGQSCGGTTGNPCTTFSDTSSNINQISSTGLIPYPVGAGGSPQAALEIPEVAKEQVAQFWLSDPTANLPSCSGGSTNICYNPPGRSLNVYWGTPGATDKAAIELTLVYWDNPSQTYKSKKWYLDQINRPNNFDSTSSVCGGAINPGLYSYQCRNTLTGLPANSTLVLIRARLLYNNNSSQPIGIQAVENCGPGCNIPPQATIIYSEGASGQTQRAIQVFQNSNVVPYYFDYAIFSAGSIEK